MNPAQALFEEHINSGPYQLGVAKEMWGSRGNTPNLPTWPLVLLWVRANYKKGNPDSYLFRFDLTGYPEIAPLGELWDPLAQVRLANESWPKGQGDINTIFNPNWSGKSLYAPCDRGALLEGHPAWKTMHAEHYWRPDSTIVTYLNFVYEILHSPDYYEL